LELAALSAALWRMALASVGVPITVEKEVGDAWIFNRYWNDRLNAD
jgi:hypothetical protein